MKMKSILIGLITMLFIMSAAACSSSNNNGNKPANTADTTDTTNKTDTANADKTEPAQDKVEIGFSWWGDTKRNDIYNAIADKFEAKYPNIKVNRQFGGWTDYWDKLATQIAGGGAPDVISMHQSYVSEYARRNALLDIGKYVDDSTINVQDFPASVVDSGKVGGKQFMIAQGVTMSGQFVNTTLLKSLGVEPPAMDWTWDDFTNKAIEVTEAFKKQGKTDGYWGVQDESGMLLPVFQYFVRERGKDVFTDDGKLAFDKQDVVDWFTMWQNLRDKGAIPDAATNDENRAVPLEQNQFTKGKIGIMALPANQLNLYQLQLPDNDLNMVRQPTLPGGKTGEFVEGAYLSVAAESKHPKEAAMFINFFVNEEEALKLFKVEQGSPGSTKMVEVVKPLLNDAQNKALDFIQKELEIAVKAPYPPTGITEIQTAFQDAATSVAYKKATPEKAADAFMKAAQSVQP